VYTPYAANWNMHKNC